MLTIGYGDFTPKSNARRPFFVMWSLIAIPTMTMLISQMSDTVVVAFKYATEKFAGYFVMPESGAYKNVLSHLPFVLKIMQKRQEKQRVKRGFAQADDDVDADEDQSSAEKPKPKKQKSRTRPPQDHPQRTLEELAREPNPSQSEFAQQLAFAIRRTAQDMKSGKRTRYAYEESVEFTRLIQFTNPRSRPSSSARGGQSADDIIVINEDEFGVLDWDWIGENSPVLAHQTEPEWMLDRLCGSLVRYVSEQEHAGANETGRELDQEEEATLRTERDLGVAEA